MYDKVSQTHVALFAFSILKSIGIPAEGAHTLAVTVANSFVTGINEANPAGVEIVVPAHEAAQGDFMDLIQLLSGFSGSVTNSEAFPPKSVTV